MSKLQLYSVMSVGTLIYVYTFALNSLMQSSGTSGWISAICGCIGWILFVLIATAFLGKFSGKRLSEVIYYCLGDFFGMVVNCLVVLAVILSVSERLFEGIRLMKLYGYNNTSAIIIVAIISVVAFYCSKSGEKAVSKTSVMVVFALIGGIIIVLLSGFSQFEFDNLFPIWGYGTNGTVRGGVWTLSSVDNILIGLIFADKINASKLKVSGIASSLTALAVYAISTFCYSLAFPYSSDQNNTSGIIDIARGTESGGFFQRFEAILLFIVIIGIICFVAIYLSAAVKQIDDTFGIKRKRSAILSALLTILVTVIALLPDNTNPDNDNLLQLYRQYSFIFILLISIVVLLGYFIKRNVMKRVISAAAVLTITLSLCSCGDYKEVENEAYAVMVGIDSANSEIGYLYSVRIMNENGDVASAAAESLAIALNDISQKSSRAVSLKNLRVLAISQNIAEKGILTHIEPIVRDTNTKNSIMLAICSKSAESFISAKRFDEMQEIELTVNNNQNSNAFEPTSVNTVYNNILSSTKDASAVYVINGNDFDDNKISGTAMFSGEKMVGVLDGDETAIIKAINGSLKKYPIVSDGTEYMIRSVKQAKITVDKNQANITIFLSCSVGDKNLGKMPEKVRKILKKRFNAVVEDMVTSGSDIVGLGHQVAKQYDTIQQFEKSGWKQKFKATKIKTKIVV